MPFNNSHDLQDIYILKEFVESNEMYKKLDKKFDISKLYSSDSMNKLYKLGIDSSYEDFLKLYQDNLDFKIDDSNGIVKISFEYPDKEKIVLIVETIILESELFLNNLNKKKALIEFKFIQKQLDDVSKELSSLENELIGYQTDNKIIDPALALQYQMDILNEFKIKLINISNEINIKKRYVNTDDSELKAMLEEKKEIQRTIIDIESKIFNSQKYDNNNDLVKKYVEYNNLKNKYDFTKEVYINSLSKLEMSKINTLKSSKFLEVISKPFKPDSEYAPKPFLSVLVIGVLAFIFLSLGRILLLVIKEK